MLSLPTDEEVVSSLSCNYIFSTICVRNWPQYIYVKSHVTFLSSLHNQDTNHIIRSSIYPCFVTISYLVFFLVETRSSRMSQQDVVPDNVRFGGGIALITGRAAPWWGASIVITAYCEHVGLIYCSPVQNPVSEFLKTDFRVGFEVVPVCVCMYCQSNLSFKVNAS